MAAAVVDQSNTGYLTPQELAEIGHQIEALWEPFQSRLGRGAERPEGARLVQLTVSGFPRADRMEDHDA